ncbi:MAG: hypothetical protein ACRDDY_11125 [Clostridium sp.]|uniref:hypothetical protein n=1 Tax=Clostridium sp. TaxID=1506 RepID=UPI003EE4BA47
MIRTVVCHKEGCSGNKFFIKSVEEKVEAICSECRDKKLYDLNDSGYFLVSTCGECKNDTFKLFLDTDKETVFIKCIECGQPPEKILIDEFGNQISFKDKLLNDVKDALFMINQRMGSLELKVEDIERGQGIIEESLAYINRYIVEDR